jgi:hypothetical protein
MEKLKRAVLVRGTNLTNAAMVLHTVALAQKYCIESGLSQPPIPSDVSSFFPCTLEMSEWEGVDGERIGRLQFLADDGRIISDEEWPL